MSSLNWKGTGVELALRWLSRTLCPGLEITVSRRKQPDQLIIWTLYCAFVHHDAWHPRHEWGAWNAVLQASVLNRSRWMCGHASERGDADTIWLSGGCRFLRYLGLQKLICMPMFVKPLAYRECHLSIRLSCKYSTRSNTQAVPYIWRNYVMWMLPVWFNTHLLPVSKHFPLMSPSRKGIHSHISPCLQYTFSNTLMVVCNVK